MYFDVIIRLNAVHRVSLYPQQNPSHPPSQRPYGWLPERNEYLEANNRRLYGFNEASPIIW